MKRVESRVLDVIHEEETEEEEEEEHPKGHRAESTRPVANRAGGRYRKKVSSHIRVFQDPTSRVRSSDQRRRDYRAEKANQLETNADQRKRRKRNQLRSSSSPTWPSPVSSNKAQSPFPESPEPVAKRRSFRELEEEARALGQIDEPELVWIPEDEDDGDGDGKNS